MKYPLAIYTLLLMIFLVGACTEQDAPQPYDQNLAKGGNDLLLPTEPMVLDSAIMNPDAGPLPEATSVDSGGAEAGSRHAD